MGNRSLSHTRWECQYHIVFIPSIGRRHCMEKYEKMSRNSQYIVQIQ